MQHFRFVLHPSFLISLGVFILLPRLVFAQPDTLWTREFDNGGDDYATVVMQTDDGSFVFAGSSWHDGSMNLQLTRTEANGHELWSRDYGTAQNDWCNAMIPVSAGGWLLSGFTFPPNSFFPNIILVRTTESGDTLWTRIIGDSAISETANAVVELPDGGFLLIGIKDLSQEGLLDAFLLRLNSSGDTVWTRTYELPGSEDTSNLCQLADGSYLISGSYTNESNGSDFYFMKITPAGDTLWTRSFGGEGFDLVQDAKALPDGGAVFAGLTDSFGEMGDLYLGRINGAGDTVWTHTYGGDDEDHAHTLALTSDGGVLVGGHTDSFGAVNGDVFLVKTDGSGNAQWVFTQPGPDYESFESIQQTSDGGVILVGNHIIESVGSNFTLLRLENITSVSDGSTPLSSSFNLSSFPNPFNASATITFSLPHPDQVRLSVFDITGRIVTTLTDAVYEAGEHQLTLDASLWPSGIYVYRLESARFTAQKKLVLIK